MVQATRKCSIDDCANQGKITRGLCNKHYQRWLKHGDPLKLVQFHTSEESFKARTRWQGKCLIWQGATNKDGYGSIRSDGVMKLAHRYAWERHNGKIPADMEVDHSCRNRLCVNKDHLRLATRSQNCSNKPALSPLSKSGFRNVYKKGNSWQVRAKKNGKVLAFGTFKELDDAVERAAEVREQLFGHFSGI